MKRRYSASKKGAARCTMPKTSTSSCVLSRKGRGSDFLTWLAHRFRRCQLLSSECHSRSGRSPFVSVPTVLRSPPKPSRIFLSTTGRPTLWFAGRLPRSGIRSRSRDRPVRESTRSFISVPVILPPASARSVRPLLPQGYQNECIRAGMPAARYPWARCVVYRQRSLRLPHPESQPCRLRRGR